MKFLCVQCDAQMKIGEVVKHDDIGSLSVVFTCEECKQQTAMLTNAHETQLVTSLGVKIGPDGDKEEASKCPFANMLPSDESKKSNSDEILWNSIAKKRLEQIPEFVRPMAKMGIEKFAKDNGLNEINEEVLEQAMEVFGF